MRLRFSNSYTDRDRFGATRNFSSQFEVEGTYREVMESFLYITNTDKVIGYNTLKPIQFIEKNLIENKKKKSWW